MVKTIKYKVDLHLHSSCSDGLLRPGELIGMASGYGLSAVALTDHDTVEGLEEAFTAGKKHQTEVVAGVEIGVIEKGREIHILGYGLKKLDRLQESLYKLRSKRAGRMAAMLKALNRLGFSVSESEIAAESGEAAPGRLHLARLLHRKGYVNSIERAFKSFIGKGQPAYIPRETYTLAQTIKLLTDCGAVPVLAHPGRACQSLVGELVAAGIRGIEVFHPDHDFSLRHFYLQVAEAKGLVVTGGSDYHGDNSAGHQYPTHLAVDGFYLDRLKILMN